MVDHFVAEEAKALEEERTRQHESAARLREQEEQERQRVYWAEMEKKNALALSSRSPQREIRLHDALAACSPKGSFMGLEQRMRQAKRVKEEVKRRRREEAVARRKEEELW